MTAHDQFFESMAEAIAERIENKLAVRKRIYSLNEAAEYFGLSRKALQQKTARGEINPVDMDRLLRYDILDLDTYISAKKRRETQQAYAKR